MQTGVSGKPVMQFQSRVEHQEPGELMEHETDAAAQAVNQREWILWLNDAHPHWGGNLL